MAFRPIAVSLGIAWDTQDHAELVPYMLECLRGDGFDQLVESLLRPGLGGASLADALMLGARAADSPLSPHWVNVVAHFHDPCTHRGLAGLPCSAAAAAADIQRRAVGEWRRGDRRAACIDLGRCLHLIADVGGIPHHAAGIGYLVGDPHGHRDYENWLRDGNNWRRYAVTSGGYYAPWYKRHVCASGVHVTSSTRTYDWIDQAAVRSRELMPLVDKRRQGYREAFPYVAGVLVPATIRWGAGFIQRFFADAAVGAPQV